MHDVVVGLLGCKCAAVTDKAARVLGVGNPEPKVGSRIAAGLPDQTLRISGGKSEPSD